MNRLVKKKIVKLEKETRKFGRVAEEQQAKVNDIQQKIFEGNQTLERLKSKINLNQEDMEKWMLAAKQKKEDNLMLEKYKRSDETKVKEIGLEIERLTVERGKLERGLANQVTETKACQIEVDKLVQEFNFHSEERQRVFSQWDSVVANLAKRNELQLEIGDRVARLEKEISEKQDKVEEKGRYLRREREQNGLKKEEIKKLVRENFQEKNTNYQKKKEVEDFTAQIKIIQNRLSGRARELESRARLTRREEGAQGAAQGGASQQEEAADEGRERVQGVVSEHGGPSEEPGVTAQVGGPTGVGAQGQRAGKGAVREGHQSAQEGVLQGGLTRASRSITSCARRRKTC